MIRDEQWILDHFRNPRELIADSIMPAFRFTDASFEALTAYLTSLDEQPEPLAGKESFETYACAATAENGDGQGGDRHLPRALSP